MNQRGFDGNSPRGKKWDFKKRPRIGDRRGEGTYIRAAHVKESLNFESVTRGKGISWAPVLAAIIGCGIALLSVRVCEAKIFLQERDSKFEKMNFQFPISISDWQFELPSSVIFVFIVALISGYTILHDKGNVYNLFCYLMLLCSDSFVMQNVMNSTTIGFQTVLLAMTLFTMQRASSGDFSMHIFACCSLALLLSQRIEAISMIWGLIVVGFGSLIRRSWLLASASVILSVAIPLVGLWITEVQDTFTTAVTFEDVFEVLKQSDTAYLLWMLPVGLLYVHGDWRKQAVIMILGNIISVISLMFAPVVVAGDGAAYSVLMVRIILFTSVGYIGSAWKLEINGVQVSKYVSLGLIVARLIVVVVSCLL